MDNSAKSEAGAKRVVIVGGGVAGLEAMLACRDLLGARAEVTMAAPRSDFAYKPFAVGEPFGAAEIVRFDLARVAEDCGARYHWGSATGIDADRRQVQLHDGNGTLDYDYLVVAAGVQLSWPFSGATTYWGVADEAGIENVLNRVRDGVYRRIAFTTPGGHGWALPLYELALQAKADFDRAGVEAEVVVVTPEESPLGVFGHRVGSEVDRLMEESGIEVYLGAHPVRFQNQTLEAVPGRSIRADAVVSLPRMEGRRIKGVPTDREGFVPTDDRGAIIGLEHAWAIGDITTFPVKQGGIATQQADLAAEAIAADLGLGPEPAPFDPILRAILWTGGEPRYLYGQIGGGHGETSAMSSDSPWDDHGGKIIGRYITPYMAEATEAVTP